ncbi:uncharacterized protein BDZ99DRAFT_574422 [Mytilinidion resinicola]|uniref:Uncharacterized protein n=1 Tax=Mytilinidion resinicola TaxID=574789 RepID=A0A6A6YBL2_9PEZI|nr:uncharacterized protein BDZ99DRAFT_574422 [Mytilinidion resinicola]KAF2805495.1 hypothetical protein BDZ99DRAFT_574422 [Mytilinidion resinicola]
MPRLVRRAPLSERVAAYLNPLDFLLWLSEELNGNDWDEFQRAYALPMGIGMNVVFIIARANSKPGKSYDYDVFADSKRYGSGWFSAGIAFLIYLLTTVSFLNAWYTFSHKRHYRLFEQSVDVPPSTPSAHRVRVDSSPIASSPLRFLSNMMSGTTAESRAHPDAARDVWEVAVWDPNPLCLELFCWFSPVHVMTYYFFLPLAPLEPQPMSKIATMISVVVLLSVQLHFLRTSFAQQSKDSALIQREVMNEYDTKFVHPALQRPVRDVGVQMPPPRRRESGRGIITEVDTYTPTTIINRGFRTNPNPSYASQYDPEDNLSKPEPRISRRSSMTPSLHNANGYFPPVSTSTSTADFSSPIRPVKQLPAMRQPKFRQSDVGAGDGGSLGVYSHAASPLRKAASTNQLHRNSNGERRRDLSPEKREGSPLKRMSTAGVGEARATGATPQRFPQTQYGGLGVGRRESGRF